jgi:hypothetical protein
MDEAPRTTRSRAARIPRVPRILRTVVPRGTGTRASDAPRGRATRLLTAGAQSPAIVIRRTPEGTIAYWAAVTTPARPPDAAGAMM